MILLPSLFYAGLMTVIYIVVAMLFHYKKISISKISILSGLLFLFLCVLGAMYGYDVYLQPKEDGSYGISDIMRWLTFDDDFRKPIEKAAGFIVIGVVMFSLFIDTLILNLWKALNTSRSR